MNSQCNQEAVQDVRTNSNASSRPPNSSAHLTANGEMAAWAGTSPLEKKHSLKSSTSTILNVNSEKSHGSIYLNLIAGFDETFGENE
jgi:hypothetical protein